jgi:hypothetical protein
MVAMRTREGRHAFMTTTNYLAAVFVSIPFIFKIPELIQQGWMG